MNKYCAVPLMFVLFAMTACGSRLFAQEESTKAPEAPPAEKVAKKQSGEQWTLLFDGKQMKDWKPAKGYVYDDAGKVEVKDGNLVLHGGQPATGVRCPGKLPKINYEIRFEAQRVEGNDFFAGMSFPVGDEFLTLILGGWGGYVTGLSCVDGYWAEENETVDSWDFENGKWYRICVRVTQERVTATINDKKICDLETEGHKLSVTFEMEPCLPFGFATWNNTTGALRNIRYRQLAKDEITAPAK